MATAHALATHFSDERDVYVFNTCSGLLRVWAENSRYTKDLPARKPKTAQLPEPIGESLGLQPLEVLKARDYVLVYEREEDVKNIQINKTLFDRINIDPGGVIMGFPQNSVG